MLPIVEHIAGEEAPRLGFPERDATGRAAGHMQHLQRSVTEFYNIAILEKPGRLGADHPVIGGGVSGARQGRQRPFRQVR